MKRALAIGAAVAAVLLAAFAIRRPTDSGRRKAPPFVAPKTASISWVSTDREAFAPLEGEEVSFRFRVSAAGLVELRLLDAREKLVRTFRREVSEPGELRIRWDGRDEEGAVVSDDAYVYTLHLFPSGGKDEVVYDLRGMTGGEPIAPYYAELDEATGTIAYALPRKSRVHLLMVESYVPAATRLDWAAELGGAHETSWSEAGPASSSRPRGAYLRAMALPDNVVLVAGVGADGSGRLDDGEEEEVPYRLEAATKRPQYHHALHPRARCYDPVVEARVLHGASGEAILRLRAASEQGTFHARPSSRVAIHVYVDGKLALYEPEGYLPYHYRLEPEDLGAREHEVTAVVSWREEHTGIARTRIRIGAMTATD